MNQYGRTEDLSLCNKLWTRKVYFEYGNTKLYLFMSFSFAHNKAGIVKSEPLPNNWDKEIEREKGMSQRITEWRCCAAQLTQHRVFFFFLLLLLTASDFSASSTICQQNGHS
jgi:hypothetical protein